MPILLGNKRKLYLIMQCKYLYYNMCLFYISCFILYMQLKILDGVEREWRYKCVGLHYMMEMLYAVMFLVLN